MWQYLHNHALEGIGEERLAVLVSPGNDGPVVTRRSGTLGVLAALLALLTGAGVVVAGPAEPAPPSYVALGDSYTAGPYIPSQVGEPVGCRRSDHNYPHRVARVLGGPFLDASCSGATTDDLFAPQAVQGGENPPQLDAVRSDTAVVTVGIGGNDIGFGEIATSCISVAPLGSPCQSRYTAGGVDQVSQRIAATAPKVAAVLAEIRRRAPAATTYVVGYPAILPEGPPGCWPVMPYTLADAPYLREKEKELNAMLAGQAAAAGAVYVDTYAPSVGHDACALPLLRWVEPVVPASPAAPLHPNALGMKAGARAVLAAMGAPEAAVEAQDA